MNILLIDKGYYDYDFTEPPKPKVPLKKRSTREVGSILARFGFKTKLHDGEKKPMTAEEMQRIVMEEQNSEIS